MSDYGPPPRYQPAQPYPQDPHAHPSPGYPPAPPPGPPAAPSARDRLGSRVARRPEPRFGVALAGVGVALVILGVLVWAGEYAASGGGSGSGFGGGGSGTDSHKLLGAALSLAVVVIGYALAIGRRVGPLTNAGVAASALGVPVMVGFISLQPASGISVDAVAIVSMLVWVLSYAVVPVVRGHVFYAAATTLTLWLYLIDKVEPHLFSFAWVFRGIVPDTGGAGFQGPGFAAPDFNTIAGICLVFGLAYYLTALFLDRAGRSGLALAFVVGGFAATASGIATAAINLAQVATGFLLIVLGALLAAYGASSGRRFTTWAWAAAIGVGVFDIIAKASPDNAAAAGISFIIVGVLVVALAATAAQLLREPDETVPASEVVGRQT
jgi:hypothetical protein